MNHCIRTYSYHKFLYILQNRLDDSIVGADEIRELHTAMSHLYENAISKKASQENRAEYLAVSFTFQKGMYKFTFPSSIN